MTQPPLPMSAFPTASHRLFRSRLDTMARGALTLLELTAAVAMLALVAAVVIPRVAASRDTATAAGCHVLQGDIEVQVELWRQRHTTWPASNLSDIGADTTYFPEGLPVCPVDGSSYTIDASGEVVGHSH